MQALYLTLSLRYLRRRWFWALLIVASIALGVAMLAATQALNQTMVKAGRSAGNPLAGSADLQISNSDFGVRRDLAERVTSATVHGVQSVQPIILKRIVLPDLDGSPALLLGIDADVSGAGANPWGIELKLSGLPRPGHRPAFVGSELAKALPRGPGSFRVRVAGRDHAVAGIGTVQAKGTAAMLSGSIVVMRLADAAALLGRPDYVSRIDVTLQPGTDREAVRQQIATLLEGQADVRTAEAGERSIRDIMVGLEVALFLGGAGALVVGLFLVYNALSVSVAERRHEIGILRAVGATRGQIQMLFAGEAALLGLVGSLLGAPLGLALASLALGPMQAVLSDVFVPLDIRQLEVTPLAVFGGLAAGIVTALLAALVPAMQAAAEEPADAVRRVPQIPSVSYRIAQAGGALLLGLAGLGFVALRTTLPQRVGAFGGVVCLLIAALVAAPILATFLARLLQPITRHLLGIEGRLAADNLARSPGRTGLVIAALAAGVALVLETTGVMLSSEREVLGWIDESIGADLFVTANSPISSGGQNTPIDEQLGRHIAALPGVESALPARFQRVEFRDRLVFLLALDADGFYHAGARGQVSPRRMHFDRILEPGTALVSHNFAALYHLGEGDSFTLRGPQGPVMLRITGLVVDYSWNRGTILVDRGWYRQVFQDDLVDVFDVFLREEADVETVRETILRRWGAQEGLVVLTRAELLQRVADTIQRLYTIPRAQGIVVGLVAGLGVVVALLISVLQRRRELGLLRAVGATRAQVLRSVLAEATLMGIIGSVVGLAVGIPLEWYAVRIVLFDESGFLLPVVIPWAAASGIIGGAILLATLAGLGPAVHAVHVRIPEAIAYE